MNLGKISERSGAPPCALGLLRWAASWRSDGRVPHLRQEIGLQLLMRVLHSRGLSQWGLRCGSCHMVFVHSPQSAAGLSRGERIRVARVLLCSHALVDARWLVHEADRRVGRVVGYISMPDLSCNSLVVHSSSVTRGVGKRASAIVRRC